MYGSNKCFIENNKLNFSYSFSAEDSLKYCNFEVLNQSFCDDKNEIANKLNAVNVKPTKILVKDSAIWKNKNFDEVKDFKKIE